MTQTGLSVVATDAERNLLLVKGAVPGSKGSLVVIKRVVSYASDLEDR